MTRARPSLSLLVCLSMGAAAIASTQTDAQADDKKVVARRVKPRPHPQPIAPMPEPTPDVPVGPDSGVAPLADPPKQLVEATATIWAQAGSRSWTGCSSVAKEAKNQLGSYGEETNNYRENHHWAIQAGECPNAPEVLTMAARSELLRRFPLPEGLDTQTDLTELEASIDASRERASAWIDDAQAELARRRDRRSLGLEYWRGRGLLSTGDLAGAREALTYALNQASVEGWKLRRLLALTELYAGNLDAALLQAKRAYVDSPSSDQVASYFVLGLVLDRAGDQAGARRRTQAALDRDDGGRMRALETAMPIHERLYLRAYAKTVRGETSGALRLWDAYLARPEPEDPERRLAERHQAALRPLPSGLGGPAHPDEGEAAARVRPKP